MKIPLTLLSPLVLLILGVVLIRGHLQTSSQPVEKMIESASQRNQWTLPYVSKYISFQYPQGSKLNNYAAYYLFPGSLDQGMNIGLLESALRYAGKYHGLKLDGINVNKLPKKNKLNLYFFDSDSSPQFAMFKKQCVSAGVKNIILCDARFLMQFSEIALIEKRLDAYLEPGSHFSSLFDNKTMPVRMLLHDLAASHYMMLWALMHELGHMVHRHQAATRFAQIVAPTQTRSRSRAMEEEADRFAVAVIGAYSDDGKGLLVHGISNVAAGLIASALQSRDGMLPVPLAELNHPIPVAPSKGTHPPMLIRLLDAMIVFEHSFPEFSRLHNPTFRKLRGQVIEKS